MCLADKEITDSLWYRGQGNRRKIWPSLAMVADWCRWLMLMIADADEREYADDDGGRRGGRWEDNGGMPITQDR